MKIKQTLCTFVVLLALSVTSSAQINLTSGLVAHYEMNNTVNADDATTNGNDGTVNGATLTTDRNGTANEAYDFDGTNDWIDITSNTNMSPTGAVSIAAWINTSGVSTEAFIYDRIESNDGYGLKLTTGGDIKCTLNGGQGAVTSNTSVDDGNWHHVAATWDQSTGDIIIYIDGVQDIIGNFTNALTYIPQPRNGIGSTGSSAWYDGKVDELRIYNRAINECEVKALAEVLDLTSNKEAQWQFANDELDATANNNDGVLNGATITTDRFNTVNEAYDFDGVNDYIDIPVDQNMSPTDEVSITAWVLTTGVSSEAWIYDRIETSDGYGLKLTTAGTLKLTINGGNGVATSTDTITDGKWHCVVGTYDQSDGDVKVYIDGQLAGSSSYSTAIDYSPEPRNSIGGNSTSGYFDGRIDDLRVYSRELQDCEVEYLCDFFSTRSATAENAYAEFSGPFETLSNNVYPNPFDQTTTLYFKGAEELSRTVLVYDMTGKLVREYEPTTDQQLTITRDELRGGVYVFRVFNAAGQVLEQGKMMVR